MKTLLILFPYKFTEFYYHKYELIHLKKKNYEVIVHDLADINTNSKFIKSIKTKTKVNRQVIRFSSLISWIKAFNKIRKTKKVLVYNMVDEASFNILIIKLFLKLSNVTIAEYRVIDIPEWIRRKKSLKDFFRSILRQKRKFLNFSFFFF